MGKIEIKYFSPDGRKDLPNGSIYQKGGFIYNCKKNKARFIEFNNQYFINNDGNMCEAIHPEQYGLSDYRGGIIVFSTDINSLKISKNKLLDWFEKKLKTFKNRLFYKKKINNIIKRFNEYIKKEVGGKKIEDYIGAFSIGNFFNGRYVGDNEKVFDKNSLSIEINGISSESLIFLAEEVAQEFIQETVLVKDLNSNKIFLVDQDKTGSYDLSMVNKKV